MIQEQKPNDPAFEVLMEDSRIARGARMLDEGTKLEANQRTEIGERFQRFITEHNYTQAQVAHELGWSRTTMSDVARMSYSGKAMDVNLVRLHNWMELAARRDNLVRNKKFVETEVAKEVIQVARVVAETCGMGVIFGPARIGKSMTLQALEGDQRFGDPVLITVNDSTVHPFALCRSMCDRFELSTRETYDRVFAKLAKRLKGTKRMLMIDEADLCAYRTLEMIRQLHDATACPVLLSGKPKVYERCGLRDVGDFSEVTDQLAGRIVIRRDLTERTRGKNPKPLFSLDDIRKLIANADLKIHVAPQAVKWLQGRASSLGCGGLSYTMAVLYYAFTM